MNITGTSARPRADELIGTSPAIQEARRMIERLGPSGLSVLIDGPTGVGKELVAQALHRASGRRGALIAVNVCAIPDSMFESLLFGHVRGAFTGAVSDHVGHITEAHGGTLFLDEIGELPLPLQAKLLRVLETRVFRKVGGRHDESSDFRLIVATNADLGKAVAAGSFRADLAFRFGAASVRIPALRERVQDIPVLATHFTDQILGPGALISPEALLRLSSYAWPGNVRELRHAIELASTFAEGSVLNEDAVKRALGHRSGWELDAAVTALTPSTPDSAERESLLNCLCRHGWHMPSVARELGVTKKTVYARIQRHRIVIPGRHRRRQPPAVEFRGSPGSSGR